MLIAVTGGTGFVGRHLISHLLTRGHHVRALVRGVPDGQFLDRRGLELVSGSVHDGRALATLLAGAHAVVHLVGIIAEWGSATFTAIHVDGTRRVLAAARDAGVRRFVHMSALGARADARATAYHRSKWEAEELVRNSGIAAAILRPSLISGSGSVPIRALARLHRWSPVIPIFGDGQFPIQPVWIGDVTLAFALAVERPDLVGTFELGGPAILTYEEFVGAIGRASGHPRRLLRIPLVLARCAARAFDPLGPMAPITSIQLRMLIEGATTPSNALKPVFGIRPLGFEEGLSRYLPLDNTRAGLP